jgi:hypothetical protein
MSIFLYHYYFRQLSDKIIMKKKTKNKTISIDFYQKSSRKLNIFLTLINILAFYIGLKKIGIDINIDIKLLIKIAAFFN